MGAFSSEPEGACNGECDGFGGWHKLTIAKSLMISISCRTSETLRQPFRAGIKPAPTHWKVRFVGAGVYLPTSARDDSGVFSRRSQGYYGEVGAALYKIAERFYNLSYKPCNFDISSAVTSWTLGAPSRVIYLTLPSFSARSLK